MRCALGLSCKKKRISTEGVEFSGETAGKVWTTPKKFNIVPLKSDLPNRKVNFQPRGMQIDMLKYMIKRILN